MNDRSLCHSGAEENRPRQRDKVKSHVWSGWELTVVLNYNNSIRDGNKTLD